MFDEKAGLIEKDNGFIDGLNGHITGDKPIFDKKGL